MKITSETLRGEIEATEWHWLRPHLERQAVIVVADDLDLAAAAAAVAGNDAGKVGQWIAGGRIGKPSPEQIDAWNADPTRRFRFLIIQPWVLIQSLPPEGDRHG